MGGFKGTSFQFLTDESLTGPVFGRKPNVPPWEEMDLSEEQKKAIAANIAAEPEAQKLAGLTADEIDRLIAREAPGLKGIGAQISKNLGAWNKGEMSPEMAAYIQRSDAAKAFAGGYAGTGMHAGLTARDLGLTDYQIQRAAIPLTESWQAAAEQLYSPALQVFKGMLITPEQQAQFDFNQKQIQWNIANYKELVAAAPEPAARGIYDTIMNAVISYLGGSYKSYNAQDTWSSASRNVTSVSDQYGSNQERFYGNQAVNRGSADVYEPSQQTMDMENAYWGNVGGGGSNSSFNSAIAASFI